MQAFLDSIAAGMEGVPHWLVYAVGMIAFGAIVVFGFILPVAGVTSWVERRVWARIQSRIGPNRVGPGGFLQWLADGLKNLLKEDVIPDAVDQPLFRLAPYVVVAGFVGAFVALPFAGSLIIADLNIGILYVTAVTSLVVVGILMAGWSSNNKWSMLGGIRSATQIICYEIPVGLSIFPVVLLSGTLSMQGIIASQGWAPQQWHMFHSPFLFAAFLMFFVGALAEGNRTPFDLPEAESELVAGFATEYSGMRSLLFFLAEWGNLYVIGALVTTLFMGGWQVPAFTGNTLVLTAAQFGTFFLKAYLWVFVAMWIRATLPRVRIDQLMSLCWKYMVPIGLVNLLGTAVMMVLVPEGSDVVRWVMLALALFVLLKFGLRVRYHLRRANYGRMGLGAARA
ncbi:MAG TPA: NADH-quinone oxidoreductase subunit NuoH [Candidatus Binatia bacterium]|nr:NADH-quinone oxidoreductase subunit NuoH [Candidatus Binatia bacterium]